MRAPGSSLDRVVLAGYVFGLVALYRGLPLQVPPSLHVANGTVWLGAPMVAFLLPAAVTLTDRLLRGLYMAPEGGEPGAHADAIYDAIMLRVSLLVIGTHGVILLGLLGVLSGRSWAAVLVPAMLGATMISVGNILPRTRPNLAIGLRTGRTLADRAVWMRAHRSLGYVMVGCGATIIASAIAIPRPVGPAMILLAGPGAFAASWLLLRRRERHARI